MQYFVSFERVAPNLQLSIYIEEKKLEENGEAGDFTLLKTGLLETYNATLKSHGGSFSPAFHAEFLQNVIDVNLDGTLADI